MLKFYGIPLVWIRLSHGRDEEDQKLRRELNEFMRANDIRPTVEGPAGPYDRSHGYKPEHARMIIGWLKDHGAEVDPSVLLS